jgi:predicted RNase H-like HicB family nuclease
MRIKFAVEYDEEARMFVASWDDPRGGGITTQAESVEKLEEAISEAVRCHFEKRATPEKVALHLESDLVLQVA